MITFIIPIYNAEQYLPQCIESLLHQTEKTLQFILVDDGSTDGSLSIAQQYAKQDKRVEVYTQPHAGQSAARNHGLNYAKGEYIAFVDADDRIEPNWCTLHLQAIEDVDYVQSGYTRHKTYLPRHQYQYTSPCMRLYRRSCIHGLRFAEGMIYEDVLFSIDLWLSGATTRIIPFAGYHYTINPHSTTSQPHPEARRLLFRALRDKHRHTSLKGKIIILFTFIRLTLHFSLL